MHSAACNTRQQWRIQLGAQGAQTPPISLTLYNYCNLLDSWTLRLSLHYIAIAIVWAFLGPRLFFLRSFELPVRLFVIFSLF